MNEFWITVLAWTIIIAAFAAGAIWVKAMVDINEENKESQND